MSAAPLHEGPPGGVGRDAAAIDVRDPARGTRRAFVRCRAEIIDLLARETGKTRFDATGEAMAVCLDVCTVRRLSPRALAPRRVGLAFPGGKRRRVLYKPRGVACVIGPWNAPLTLTLGDALYALAARSAVVVKPSEVTPLAVCRAVRAMAEALPEGVLQVVTGDGGAGASPVDARARGAVVETGGERLVALGEQFHAPTVLTGVTPAMEVMRDETFGPVVAICRVQDEEEALALANQSPFGLDASIWTADLARGAKLAERLETGCVCINDCILNAGDPGLPFGGVKQSGIGTRHGGIDGIRAFTRPCAVRLDPGRRSRDPAWFPYRLRTSRLVERAMGWIWG